MTFGLSHNFTLEFLSTSMFQPFLECLGQMFFVHYSPGIFGVGSLRYSALCVHSRPSIVSVCIMQPSCHLGSQIMLMKDVSF